VAEGHQSEEADGREEKATVDEQDAADEEHGEEVGATTNGSRSTEAAAAPWSGGAGGWERAFRHDDELLRCCGLWCKKVEADGACLFRAFSDQLEGDGGKSHLRYRTSCISYLEAHKDEFAPFIEGGFKGYLAKLKEPTSWGGHIEAEALSRTLGVNVIIHMPAEAQGAEELPALAVEVKSADDDARCIQLCFHPRYHSGAHYNSVRSIGDKGDSLPATASLVEVRERMTEALRAKKPAPRPRPAADAPPLSS